jgi:hypothetical protein
MKNLAAIIAAALALSACTNTQLHTAVPSLNNCAHVKYERNGINAHIEADCQL